MKRFLFLFLATIVIMSCTDDIFVDSSLRTKVSRSVIAEQSPYYPWDDTAYITLQNIGNVTLPWYSGASTQIPVDILRDFRHKDGWELLYNFCTPTASGMISTNNYYLIFYNKFSGQLRGFAYADRDVVSGNSFWQLSFNQNTKLQSDFQTIITANDLEPDVDNKVEAVTNLTRTPVKGISRGWNCFDFDLAIYDPDIATRTVSMNIDQYNVSIDSLKLNGQATSLSEGNIISTKSLTKNIVPNGIYETGKKALLGLLKLDSTDKKETRILPIVAAGVTTLVSKGLDLLWNKFTARKTQTQDTATIKFMTNTALNIKGTISHNSQTNLANLSQLMVPGSKLAAEYIITPYYNVPLGVWYLKKTPTIKRLSEEDTYQSIPVEHKEGSVYVDCTTKGGKKEFEAFVHLYRSYSIAVDIQKSDVEINPSILPLLDHYDIDYALVGKLDYGAAPSVDNNMTPLGLIGNNTVIGDTYICRGNKVTFVNVDVPDYKIGSPSVGEKIAESFGPYISTPNFRNVSLKVSVTLYPKKDLYNPTPIVVERTVKCNTEWPEYGNQ